MGRQARTAGTGRSRFGVSFFFGLWRPALRKHASQSEFFGRRAGFGWGSGASCLKCLSWAGCPAARSSFGTDCASAVRPRSLAKNRFFGGRPGEARSAACLSRPPTEVEAGGEVALSIGLVRRQGKRTRARPRSGLREFVRFESWRCAPGQSKGLMLPLLRKRLGGDRANIPAKIEIPQ